MKKGTKFIYLLPPKIITKSQKSVLQSILFIFQVEFPSSFRGEKKNCMNCSDHYTLNELIILTDISLFKRTTPNLLNNICKCWERYYEEIPTLPKAKSYYKAIIKVHRYMHKNILIYIKRCIIKNFVISCHKHFCWYKWKVYMGI